MDVLPVKAVSDCKITVLNSLDKTAGIKDDHQEEPKERSERNGQQQH